MQFLVVTVLYQLPSLTHKQTRCTSAAKSLLHPSAEVHRTCRFNQQLDVRETLMVQNTSLCSIEKCSLYIYYVLVFGRSKTSLHYFKSHNFII